MQLAARQQPPAAGRRQPPTGGGAGRGSSALLQPLPNPDPGYRGGQNDSQASQRPLSRRQRKAVDLFVQRQME